MPEGNEPLFHSPIGLFDFQAEHVAQSYFMGSVALVADTGLGKSIIAMATACLLIEDDLIDLVVVCAESKEHKLPDWIEDFQKFTSLDVCAYHGTPAKRAKLRANLTAPQVWVSTYETIKNDSSVKEQVASRKRAKLRPRGELADLLATKRVLMVYDEMPAKLGGSRSSGNYEAHHGLVKRLRSESEARVLALTATPIERDPENIYNIMRIIDPSVAGKVADFERDYVVYRDIYDRAKFKNLDVVTDPGTVPFRDRIAPAILRKRKTDPDVVEQFPDQIEEWEYVHLDRAHLDFYRTVEEIFDDSDDPSMFDLLRMIAGHPRSLIGSQGEKAQQIVATVGEDGINALGSAKTDFLLADLARIATGQGEQVLIFTYFAHRILPVLHEILTDAGHSVAATVEGLSHGSAKEAEHAFRDQQAQILLSSDAGAKGVNLPNATYTINYEAPTTFAGYIQRISRQSRINSTKALVFARTYVALDTIEEAIVGLNYRRNRWSDALLDHDADEGHLSAAERSQMRQRAHDLAQHRLSLPRANLSG